MNKDEQQIERLRELLIARGHDLLSLGPFEVDFIESVLLRHDGYSKTFTPRQKRVVDGIITKYAWFDSTVQIKTKEKNAEIERQIAGDAKDVNNLLNNVRLGYFDKRTLENFGSWLSREQPLSMKQRASLDRILLRYSKQLNLRNTTSKVNTT